MLGVDTERGAAQFYCCGLAPCGGGTLAYRRHRVMPEDQNISESEGQPEGGDGTQRAGVPGQNPADLDLAKEELHYSRLLESVRAIVWRIDAASLRFKFVSKATNSLLGYPSEEWIQPPKVSFDRTHPEDREQVREFLLRAIREKCGCDFEHRVIAADGRIVWLRSVVQVLLEDAVVKELVGVEFDITRLKETQESLRTALAEVERLKNSLQQENVYLRQRHSAEPAQHRIIGQSPALTRVLALAEQVAGTDSTVLLLGETGTGKELLAAYIHGLSARGERAMVSVNCAAMPGPLIESELFGREKGAFTGALSRQVGRFELADNSTLFLDEVGELPFEVQSKLLRALETRHIERLGNPRPVPVNARIIAATNQDLEKAVTEGRFRRDLYYRLNVFPLTIPPLRERPEDIPALVWAFVDEFAKTFHKNIESIGQESMEALQNYPWPGNIRELRNVVERAMIVAVGPKLRIPLPVMQTRKVAFTGRKLEEVEREHVLGILEKSGWRVRGPGGAAETLGLKPTTLEARMAKLGIRRPGNVAETAA